MSEKKRKRKNETTEPTKDELELAKHVRFKTPKKPTVLQKESVEYFVGSKAVDTIMNSKWSKPTKKGEPLIGSRDDAVAFMQKLLKSRYFYRAKKVLKEPKVDKMKKLSKSKPEDIKGSPKVRRRKDDGDKKEKSKKIEKEEAELKSDKVKKADKPEEKKKKKYKLEVHDDHEFFDSNDVYVWLFDPIHPKTLLLGGIILLGVIAATLFPLWPPFVRVGVYYLSVVGGIFVGAILGTAVLRTVLFTVVWVGSIGKHHIWVLPNLLADVGFFDSFKPLYTHEVRENKSKLKDKDSGDEEEDDEHEKEESETGQNLLEDQKMEDSSKIKNEFGVIESPGNEDIKDLEKENSSGSDYEIIAKGTSTQEQTSC